MFQWPWLLYVNLHHIASYLMCQSERRACVTPSYAPVWSEGRWRPWQRVAGSTTGGSRAEQQQKGQQRVLEGGTPVRCTAGTCCAVPRCCWSLADLFYTKAVVTSAQQQSNGLRMYCVEMGCELQEIGARLAPEVTRFDCDTVSKHDSAWAVEPTGVALCARSRTCYKRPKRGTEAL